MPLAPSYSQHPLQKFLLPWLGGRGDRFPGGGTPGYKPTVSSPQAHSLPAHFLPEEVAGHIGLCNVAKGHTAVSSNLGLGEASWNQNALGSNLYQLPELKSLKSGHSSWKWRPAPLC